MGICSWCEKEFKPIRKGHKSFCGRLCARRFNQRKCSKKEYEKKYIVNCERCKKEFKIQSLHIKRFYCSPICRNKKTIEKRICKNCGEEFVIIRKDKIFCSRYCKEDYKKKQKYGFDWDGKECFCGFNKVIDIHHIDLNNENNEYKNLIPLCPNHHAMIHRDLAKIIKRKFEEDEKKMD